MHIQHLKIIQLTAFAYVLWSKGEGGTFFKGFKRGNVPRLEGGQKDPKGGGVNKNPVNRNENLQTPRPHKKWYVPKLLDQTKGAGVSGSFKLYEAAKKVAKPKKKVVKKKPTAKKAAKKPAAKKQRNLPQRRWKNRPPRNQPLRNQPPRNRPPRN